MSKKRFVENEGIVGLHIILKVAVVEKKGLVGIDLPPV